MKKIFTYSGFIVWCIGLILSLLLFLFSGCRTKQDFAQKEAKNIELDLSQWQQNDLNEVITRALETVFKQRLNIKLSQTKYDTRQPADTATGLPPVSEVNNIHIDSETEAASKETAKEESAGTTRSNQEQKLADRTVTDVQATTEIDSGFSFPFDVVIPILIGVVIIFTIRAKQ